MPSSEHLVILSVDGTDYTSYSARGRIAIDELFQLEVRAAIEGDAPVAKDLLGLAATLTIAADTGETLVVTGRVGRCRVRLSARGHELQVTLVPNVALAAEGLGSTVRAELKVSEVIEKTLALHGVTDAIMRLGTHPVRPHWLQHRESDWDYIERVAADAGIHYFFDLSGEETKLAFSDDSTHAEAAENATFVYRPDPGLTPGTAVAFAVSVVERATTGKVVVRDYTPARSNLSLEGESGTGDERYEFPGGFDNASHATPVAKRRLESRTSKNRVVRGRLSRLGPLPGATFAIDEHPHPALGDKLLCTALEIVAVERQNAQESGGLSIEFEAVPANDPYRPAQKPALVVPPQTGVVVGPSGEEIHTEEAGRVRAQLRADRDGKHDQTASTWMRVAEPMTEGSMALPRIGWEVLVAPELGDGDRPMVMGSLYDGQRPPPYALPAQKRVTAWRSATSPGDGFHEIRFDDKAGSELVHLHSSKDAKLQIDDSKQQRVGHDHTHSVGGKQTVHVKEKASAEIKTDQTVTVGGDEALDIEKDRFIDLRGKQTGRVDAARKVKIEKGIDVDIDGDRTLQVGAAAKLESEAGISYETLDAMDATVAAAFTCKADKGLEVVVGKDARTTIAAARMVSAQKGFALDVEGKVSETIGAACVIDAAGDAAEASEKAFSVTVGAAMVGAAPTIEIVAEEQITIVCGATSLTIKKDEIELKSPMIASPAPMIVTKGSKVQHNP
jgi:type VI secretion system secreted protein VgrG